MIKYKFILISTIVVILLFTFNVFAIEINIPGQVSVSRDEILLGAIARINGEENALIEELKAIELGNSPLPGYSSRLSRELIRLVLKNKGYDVDDFVLDIPRVFTVSTNFKVIPKDILLDFATKYIRDNISYPAQKLKIETDTNFKEIIIPDSSYSLEIDNDQEIHPGNISLPVVINIGGKEYKRVYLLLAVKLIQDVFVANKDLQRGVRLKKNDFNLVQREMNRELKGIITNWDEQFLAARVLSSPLKKGGILQESILKKPFVINWGDNVRAIIKIGNVEISTIVFARERGKIGDYITVENLKTKHKFSARVINAKIVRVDG